jgi:hypothetical protein
MNKEIYKNWEYTNLLTLTQIKKLFLIVVSLLFTLQSFSQVGVITIDKDAIEVPLGHWYVSKDKNLDNHSFFYEEQKFVESLLQNILLGEGQDIDFPKGKDKSGDLYWEIVWESGFVSTIYITTVDGFSLITCFTN